MDKNATSGPLLKVGSSFVRIGDKEFITENPRKRVRDCPPGELHDLFDLIPDITLDDLLHLVLDHNKRRNYQIWRRQLQAVHKKLSPVSNPTSLELVTHWNRILDEFNDFKCAMDLGYALQGTCVQRFDITTIFLGVGGPGKGSRELAQRLIDVKLNFTFLWNVAHSWYQGAFTIPGNNNLEGVTPEAVSCLFGLSQKIYYLSLLTEKTLDLVEYITKGKCSDPKKGKWEKKLKILAVYLDISEADQRLILAFKDCYRTAEFHKLSSVRSMTAKDRWNFLQKEENLLERVLEGVFAKAGTTPSPSPQEEGGGPR